MNTRRDLEFIVRDYLSRELLVLGELENCGPRYCPYEVLEHIGHTTRDVTH